MKIRIEPVKVPETPTRASAPAASGSRGSRRVTTAPRPIIVIV